MGARVFVVQKQMRWDDRKEELVPKFDLETAREHGELVYLLSPNAAPFRPQPIVEELREKLADFGDDDCLLLIGNPCLIGFAVTTAADFNGGRVRLLQWSGKDQRYISVDVDLFPDLPGEQDQG